SDSENEYISDSAPSSSKPKKRKYNQLYTKKWEAEFNWIIEAKKSSCAHCKICDKTINISSGKLQLVRHQDSESHRKKSKQAVNQPTLKSFVNKGPSIETATKKADMYISAFVAEHNLPFRIAEHLPLLLRSICSDSEIAKNIKCGRTKTTAVVKNVIGQASAQKLYDILKKVKFSIIIDESTDLSCSKHLVMVARYFYENRASRAEDIYREIVRFFQEKNIPHLENLIGFACDGANVMVGAHHSVMSKLKRDIPHIFLFKCICHSFALCASNACLKLPRAVEDCVRNIYNYVANSPKRIEALKEFQNFTQTKIHKILHPSQTRWLSLEQYNALKLFGAAFACGLPI
ncbi:hypothetical protein PPYR_15745, partial [Photinus pyralis]